MRFELDTEKPCTIVAPNLKKAQEFVREFFPGVHIREAFPGVNPTEGLVVKLGKMEYRFSPMSGILWDGPYQIAEFEYVSWFGEARWLIQSWKGPESEELKTLATEIVQLSTPKFQPLPTQD